MQISQKITYKSLPVQDHGESTWPHQHKFPLAEMKRADFALGIHQRLMESNMKLLIGRNPTNLIKLYAFLPEFGIYEPREYLMLPYDPKGQT